MSDTVLEYARKQFTESLSILDYARAKGLEVPAEVHEGIFPLEAEIAAGTISTASYQKFLIASGKAAALIRPATVEGIAFVAGADGRSKPRRLVTIYNALCIIIFVLLFAVQGYWFILNGLLDTLKQTQEAIAPYSALYQNVSAKLFADLKRQPSPDELDHEADPAFAVGRQSILGKYDLGTSSSPLGPDSRLSLKADDLTRLQLQLDTTTATLDKAVGFLAGWLSAQKDPGDMSQREMRNVSHPLTSGTSTGSNSTQVSTNSDDSQAQMQKRYYGWGVDFYVVRNVQIAQMDLELVNRYVLPILYGLLGSSIYLVRRINTDIKAASLTAASRIEASGRFFLGGVSGLAIAWFIVPKSSNPGTGSLVGYDTQILTNLSPLVLSFVAGYSIDLVFSIMDRIVSAFSNTAAQSRASSG